jgi:NAD(P)-dependent dehydrogenase (short-subunit alcohol dehydrogenase family)
MYRYIAPGSQQDWDLSRIKVSDDMTESNDWPKSGGAPPAGSLAWVVGVGALEGTGAALARRFAAGGLRVVITGRTPEKLDAVVEDIKKRGGTAISAPGDAGTEAGLEPALAVVREQGGLHVTVYNAGGSQWRKSPLEMETAFFEDVWRINCLGSFIVAREATRLMLERDGGALLFTGSISGVIARPKLAAYASAKFGQRALAQAFAREFGPKNIHVANIIVHGAIDGDRLNSAFPHAKEKRGPDGMVNIDSIAETFWSVLSQPRHAWTQEMDIRPYNEPF